MKLRPPFLKRPPVVSVIRLAGTIGMFGRNSMTHVALEPVIERAFRKGRPVAVALAINCPGGSPVQSSLIGATLRRVADKAEIPLYAFVEDVAASGGYWLASTADEIWADASSALGSVGVISSGFGAHVFLARHGLERRVHTAGRSKSMLDPFRPEDPGDVARLRKLLEGVHSEFIAHVRERRGDRLATGTDLFTGEFWLARTAVELGLADGIGHLKPKMRERFGDKVKFRHYGMPKSLWSRFGSRLLQDMLDGMEERAAYARFGL